MDVSKQLVIKHCFFTKLELGAGKYSYKKDFFFTSSCRFNRKFLCFLARHRVELLSILCLLLFTENETGV